MNALLSCIPATNPDFLWSFVGSLHFTNGYGDGFNRLTSRTVTTGTVQNYTYSYDRYGNRVSQTALQTGYNFNPTINPANNRSRPAASPTMRQAT